MNYDQILSSCLELDLNGQNKAKTTVLEHFEDIMVAPKGTQPLAQHKIRDNRFGPEGKREDLDLVTLGLIQYVNSVRWTILNPSNWQLNPAPELVSDALPVRRRIASIQTLEDYEALLRALNETARHMSLYDFLASLYEVARDVEVMSNVVGKLKIDLGKKAPAVQTLKQGRLATHRQMKELYKLVQQAIIGRGISTSDGHSIDIEIAIAWSLSDGPFHFSMLDKIKERAKTSPQARLAIAEFIYRQNNLHLAETLYADPALMYCPTTLSMQRQAQAFLRKGDARNAALLFSFVCMMPNLRCETLEHSETQNRLLPVMQRQNYSIYLYNNRFILSRNSDVEGRVFLLRGRLVRLAEPREPKWFFTRVRMFALHYKRGAVLSKTKEQRRPNRVGVLLFGIISSVARACLASIRSVERVCPASLKSMARLVGPGLLVPHGLSRVAHSFYDRMIVPMLIWLVSGKAVCDREFKETLVEVAEVLPAYIQHSKK